LAVEAAGGKRQHDDERRGGERGRRYPVRLCFRVWRAKVRLERQKRGRERQLHGGVHEQGIDPVIRRHRPRNQGKAPEKHAEDDRKGKPQPAAQARKGVAGGRDHGQVDDQRPWVRRARRNEQRRHERAGKPEAGERGTVQGGGEHCH